MTRRQTTAPVTGRRNRTRNATGGQSEQLDFDDNWANETLPVTAEGDRVTRGKIPVTRRITDTAGESGGTQPAMSMSSLAWEAPGETISRAAEFTPERTADWSIEQLEAALAGCWEDAPAVDALELLIDARDAADRAARLTPAPARRRPEAAADPAPPAAARPGITPPAPLRQPGDPRFVAPAAALDGTALHLPGGRRHELDGAAPRRPGGAGARTDRVCGSAGVVATPCRIRGSCGCTRMRSPLSACRSGWTCRRRRTSTTNATPPCKRCTRR